MQNATTDLPDVLEEGTYADLYPIAGDQKQQYKPTKRGGVVYYTLEASRADNLGALQQLPRVIAYAAARTLYTKVFGTFISNPVTTYDGVGLVHTSHNNTITPEVPSNSFDHFDKMINQTDVNGKPLKIYPKYGIYSVKTSLSISNDMYTGVKEHGFPGSVPPGVSEEFWKRYGVLPLQVPAGLFTPAVIDNFVWTIADPSVWETIEVGFLNGKREPQFLVANEERAGSRFTADFIALKAMHVYGTVFLNHRMIASNL